MHDSMADHARWFKGDEYENLDEAKRTMCAFRRGSGSVSDIHKYEGRLRRGSARATADLLRLQAIRKANEAEAAEAVAAAAQPAAPARPTKCQNKPGDKQAQSPELHTSIQLFVLPPADGEDDSPSDRQKAS
jgi:hypothetical protein